MRVLLDECLPKKLKRELLGHRVVTVPEQGWAGQKNGALLQLAQTEFDVFVTIDQNLTSQQNLNQIDLGIVVLTARDNQVETLKPLIPDTSKQIAQNCPARGRRGGNSFIITGNGGLPPRPGDAFTSPYPTGTVRGIPSSASSQPSTNPVSNADTSNPDRPPATPTIEEAHGWVYGPNGEVILTAAAPTATPQNAGVKPDTCPQS